MRFTIYLRSRFETIHIPQCHIMPMSLISGHKEAIIIIRIRNAKVLVVSFLDDKYMLH